MHVGIDVRKYFDFGIGTYIQNLLHQYDKVPQPDFTLFASPNDLEAIRKKHRGMLVANRSRKYSVGELFTLSYQANRAQVEVFHEPHYTLPYRLKMKQVVSVHDIIHLRFPEYFSAAKRAYARTVIGHACSVADAVIVGSAFARNELLREFSVDEKKVHVIHNGISGSFGPDQDIDRSLRFQETYGIRTPYVLYVGSLKLHKNVGVLLKAFRRLREPAEVQLVFVGERFKDSPMLQALAGQEGISDRIVDPGRLPQKDLILAYQNAVCVVLPSLYEGFGFPVLEAMASGTPAIGAKAGAIPEVMGEAGLLFDSHDDVELARLMQRVLDDSGLRESLKEKGLRNVKRFSWEHCAGQTIQVYEKVCA